MATCASAWTWSQATLTFTSIAADSAIVSVRGLVVSRWVSHALGMFRIPNDVGWTALQVRVNAHYCR